MEASCGCLGRAERLFFHLLPIPLDPACGSFLTSTLKYVLSENTLRKCLSKQALLSGNPAIVSGISRWNALSRAAGRECPECLSGMCARFAEEAASLLQACVTTLLLPTTHQTPILIRSANQAPTGTVPRGAAYTDLLERHSPLWDACQKTAQPYGNCNDSGALWGR